MILSQNSWSATSLDLTNPQLKHQIANEMENLHICQETVLDTNTALLECRADHRSPQFWQTPGFVIGEFVVTASATALVLCLTHTLGMCQ